MALGDTLPEYFADSEEGRKLIGKIGEFKQQLKDELDKQEKPEDLTSLAAQALARMIATNQHWDIRYGQLSQALSMYLEWASTGGCKSGNEHNQDVMLRFALLKSIHERVEHNGGKLDDLQEHEKAIYTQLKAYTKGETADPDALRAAISVSIRECNMHGGAAAISREDQGGAAKISSFSFVQDIKSHFARWLARAAVVVLALVTTFVTGIPGLLLAIPNVRNFFQDQLFETNNAADREMHLDATGASKTQAHKGQEEGTRKAAQEVFDATFKTKRLSSKEKSGFDEDKALSKSHAHEEVVHSEAKQEYYDGGMKYMKKLMKGGDSHSADKHKHKEVAAVKKTSAKGFEKNLES